MVLSLKRTITVQNSSKKNQYPLFDENVALNHEQERRVEPTIRINQVEIPIRFACSTEKFLPSSETISAWYLAYYGIREPRDLEPEKIGQAVEELAWWWINVATLLLD